MPENSSAIANIVIVDDNPANLKVLEDMLRQRGHEVRSFPRGRLALTAATRNPPDLVLLDINMPEMNGYEVCERLKSIPELADVPVIFLSALNETEDKVKAFQHGAVDYISKPFQFEEVHVRVETHLKLHDLKRALKLQNERLEQAVAARTRELAEAHERLSILDRSKSDFLNLISHEFRTPLNGLLGVGDLILEAASSTDDNRELQEIYEQSRGRILSILDDALLLTQIDVSREHFRSTPVSVNGAMRIAMEETAALAESRRVRLSPLSGDVGPILADETLLVRALHALLETAVKLSTADATVCILAEVTDASRNLIIESHGITIPADALPKFFDIFSIGEASTPGRDLGLGPALAYRIVSLFGASVSIANREPSGVRFTISLGPVEQTSA
jgi:DNA-binding response OmpR family regulator